MFFKSKVFKGKLVFRFLTKNNKLVIELFKIAHPNTYR